MKMQFSDPILQLLFFQVFPDRTRCAPGIFSRTRENASMRSLNPFSRDIPANPEDLFSAGGFFRTARGKERGIDSIMNYRYFLGSNTQFFNIFFLNIGITDDLVCNMESDP